MPASVVRYSKTVAAGASISIDVSYSATVLRLPGFDSLLERGELRRPKVVQVRPDGGKPVCIDGEQVARPLPTARHQARVAQYSQMVRGRLLRQANLLGDEP